MVGTLKFIAFFTVLVAIIAGIAQANQTNAALGELLGNYYEPKFQWGVMLTWWISGILSGIVFYTLAMILGHVENMSYRMRNIEQQSNFATPSSAPRIGNSKASMSSLKDFKMRPID